MYHYIHWKSLILFGFCFWLLLCFTDLLGEPSWKKYSDHISDIIKNHMSEPITTSQKMDTKFESVEPKKKLNLTFILWNIVAFVCSMFFFSLTRFLLWFFLKLFNFYRQPNIMKKMLKTKYRISEKISDMKLPDVLTKSFTKMMRKAKKNQLKTSENCEILFKNYSYAGDFAKAEQKGQLSELLKVLHETKRENRDLSLKLVLMEKDTLNAKRQIEDVSLAKEKLEKTSSLLRTTTKNYQDLSKAKARLEVELEDVTKDRDDLKTKVSILEEENEKLKENLEKIVEKDGQLTNIHTFNIQKRINELQMNLNCLNTKYVNSKSSSDLDDEPSMNKENYYGDKKLVSKSDILTEYLRPKMDNLQQSQVSLTTVSDDTATVISSEDNESPCRIISSTAAFQNFMKKLTVSKNHTGYRNIF